MNHFTPLTITLDLDTDPWGDLADHVKSTIWRIERIGVLPRATEQNKPAVFLDICQENGQHLIAGTTLALFYTAIKAIEARYGAP